MDNQMVKNGNKVLKTEAVVHYLLSRIRHAGVDPELLPGEMELCEKFKVSRVTVRRAIESLIAGAYIIRLPKRRGAVTNPEMAKNIPYPVGIAVDMGYTFSIDGSAAMALSGFLKKMGSDENCSWLYIYLNISSGESLENIIENNNLQGLFWISPCEKIFPELRRLTERRFPVVSIGTPFTSYYPVLEKNTILRNYAQSGEDIARFLLENGLRRPVYCGYPNESFRRFVEVLGKEGISFNPENLLADPGEIEEKLPSLIERNKIDSISSSGAACRYNPLMKVLSGHPEGRRIALLLERSPITLQYKRDYPNLNIRLNGENTIQKYMYRAGIQAAELFQKLIRNPGMVYDPVVIS